MKSLLKVRRWLPVTVILLVCLAAAAQAQGTVSDSHAGMMLDLEPVQIFTLLFLMLGPFKIIGPYIQLTKGAEARKTRRVAGLAIVFASISLVVAALLGSKILDTYNIPIPVMVLTGGIILFMVALRNLLEQFRTHAVEERPGSPVLSIKEALSPLAFPTIVTPYGIAAVVVMMSVGSDSWGRLAVGGAIIGIMAVNLLTMLLARRILPVMAVLLPILGAVLGVVQVALGLRIIQNALTMMGIL